MIFIGRLILQKRPPFFFFLVGSSINSELRVYARNECTLAASAQYIYFADAVIIIVASFQQLQKRAAVRFYPGDFLDSRE